MQVLNEFKFPQSARGKYDWPTLLDGRIRKLKKGSDFAAEIASFRQAGYQAARLRGLKLKTSVEKDAIVIQAVRATKKTAK